MTAGSVTHGTFAIERSYAAPPQRVFAAWADPEAKRQWFVGPHDRASSDHEMDFRVGGLEHVSGGPADGPTFSYDARYQDIVPAQRIVTTYEMHMDDARISVSVATVEFRPEGSGTRLVLTEQGAFLDGHDTPEQRETGTRELLDALEKTLG
ncbi:MAG: SRPBCC family protein [Pseudonocardiales bacterium]